jgi:2-dehydro-3-deoxyphosphogluconate aldolase/(4S)-4-hydroxy-2-oxoglutarate aldolase
VKAADFVEQFGQLKASAILRTNDQHKAALAMEAVIRGGFRVVEFTLSVPGAYELVQDFSRRDGLIVGTGTVLNAEDARLSVEAGAHFLVSPALDEGMIRAAVEMDVASMPGTHTPTEMLQATRAGAQICKLFPAPAGGPAWVKATLGPLPDIRIVPTNGVDEHNAGAWLAAGCFGVGFVATLFQPEDVAAENWDAIEARARRCLAAVNTA